MIHLLSLKSYYLE